VRGMNRGGSASSPVGRVSIAVQARGVMAPASTSQAGFTALQRKVAQAHKITARALELTVRAHAAGALMAHNGADVG
jgi:hypothetical protein